ncbi:hypothetical protein thalar_03266 [Litoreibacter arenae DSM 19593]|uniref:Uncharacterized protein n=1 Tax=Litoreibacter arenae DSM 19593 TaxID=1123360 RepID=S9Q856_9RHOB|nr:hypothetical protein thalar_03266 [Litoreibacter arenae DSM 19593]
MDKPENAQSSTSYADHSVYSVAFLMALGLSRHSFEAIFTVRAFEWFIPILMCLLAAQKLQDVERFSTMFLNYYLLARR